MTSPEPCENCACTVVALRSLVRPGGMTLWEDIGQLPVRFHADGSIATRQPMYVPHTGERCRAARRLS